MQKNKKFQIGYVLFVALIFFSSIDIYATETHPTKQEIWENISNFIDRRGGRFGSPVDKEIKKIVSALSIIGIEIRDSSEGHFDYQGSYSFDDDLFPWVELEASSAETENLWAERKQIDGEEKLLEAKGSDLSVLETEQLSALRKEGRLLWKAYKKAEMICLEPLYRLLIEFYDNRNVSYDRVLIISGGIHWRLHSVGADRQVIRTEEERKIKLVEYREEMKAFASFLKMKYMNSN
jgi:hypothetical protein